VGSPPIGPPAREHPIKISVMDPNGQDPYDCKGPFKIHLHKRFGSGIFVERCDLNRRNSIVSNCPRQRHQQVSPVLSPVQTPL